MAANTPKINASKPFVYVRKYEEEI